jgi:hypothetical protein
MPILLTVILALTSILLVVWPKIQRYITIRKHIKAEEDFDKMLDELSKKYDVEITRKKD